MLWPKPRWQICLNWEPDEDVIAIAKAELLSAQVAYQNTAAKSTLTDASNTSVRINLDQAISALASAQQAYADAMNPERDWERNIETTRENAANTLIKEQQDLEIAQANYDLAMVESTAANTSADLQSAWAKVLNAEAAMADAETPADEEEITAARNKVRELALALQKAELVLGADQEAAKKQAELALEQAQFTLASAQEALDGTTLVAPFAGTITQVNVEIGETASDAMTAIVLADLDVPVMQFWVEEADLANVALGNPVTIVFEALQDYTYRGEITQIDPVLVSVGGTPAVQSWATIDTTCIPGGPARRYERGCGDRRGPGPERGAGAGAGAAGFGRRTVCCLCGAARRRAGDALCRGRVDGLRQRGDHLRR